VEAFNFLVPLEIASFGSSTLDCCIELRGVTIKHMKQRDL